MTTGEDVRLPLCFGEWSHCNLCISCPIEWACMIHRVTPRELWAEIEQGFVAGLDERGRESVVAWCDVLDGLA
jgi:hypothetical protein